MNFTQSISAGLRVGSPPEITKSFSTPDELLFNHHGAVDQAFESLVWVSLVMNKGPAIAAVIIAKATNLPVDLGGVRVKNPLHCDKLHTFRSLGFSPFCSLVS